ncbi:MAG: hypothetical protein AB7V14_06585 [Kiritimatiellia bacterium]
MTIEDKIVRDLASRAGHVIARRVIARLRNMNDGLLAGDDSGLTNSWDEICVQIQGEKFALWSAYEDTIDGIILSELEEYDRLMKTALWLQTEDGIEWGIDNNDGTQPVFSDGALVDRVRNEYVLASAEGWSNARIRAYLGQAERRD